MIELNYREFGKGEAFIILHGLFGTSDNWQTFAKKLSGDFNVFTLDLRNHGRSPHSKEFNYEILADDIRDFMLQQKIEKTHILGHSLGGKIAMQFALKYRECTISIIVADIAPRAYSGHHYELFDTLFSLDIAAIPDRKEIEEILKEIITQDNIRHFLMKNLHRRKEGGFEWKMNLDVLYGNYEEILSAIYHPDPFLGPALFIRGEKSGYILDTDYWDILRLYPNGELETIMDAGHWVHVDAPIEMFGLVKAFMDKHMVEKGK